MAACTAAVWNITAMSVVFAERLNKTNGAVAEGYTPISDLIGGVQVDGVG
jgi:hypothetical protein